MDLKSCHDSFSELEDVTAEDERDLNHVPDVEIPAWLFENDDEWQLGL